MTDKATSIARGAAAVAVGAVFGVFALIIGLVTLAWGLNSLFSSLWLGFLVVFGLLILLTAGALLFAWRKFRSAHRCRTWRSTRPRRSRATVTAKAEGER